MPVNDNRYDRHTVGAGLVVWIYEYTNRDVIDHDGAATGLEAGVQVRGTWTQEGSQGHSGVFEPGEIHRLDSSEQFRVRFRAERQSGLQVGFALYPTEVPELADSPQLRFLPSAGSDRRLFEWAAWLAQEVEAFDETMKDEGRKVILDYVARHTVELPDDPVLRVKEAIERDFASQLYVHHWAELASMHPETLSRKFRRRFGVTPVRYRNLHRLSMASSMTWSEPNLTIAEIACRCGFLDESYFHRTFLAHFGVTPAQWGRRATSRDRGCTEASLACA